MVGTDRSEAAEQAVRWAAVFADRYGAELYVVRVVAPQRNAGTAPDSAEPAGTANLAQDMVQHARSIAGDRGHGRVVVDDDPALAMVRAAEADAIDVLIVGNRGMAGRKHLLLGNVPNRVSHNARCTVIIVNTVEPDGNGAHTPVRNPASAEKTYRPSGMNLESEPHRFARGATIAAIFLKHGLKELFGRPDEDGAVGRQRQAKRLRAAFEELGPTFAKIGQILSTRPDLLPAEFVDELAQLRDNVTPLAEQQVVRVMEQDLGVPWEDVFETIDPNPLAAGTIGQVHRAVLASGEKVVLKVQRPDARELIEQDLALLKSFSDTVGTRSTVKRWVDVPAVFEHLSSSLHRELDYRLEAGNAERMRTALAGFPRLAVPAVHTAYSTSRLLVMQDVGGVPVADVPAGTMRKEVGRQLLESFYQQIMINGFFHADPHPGNLMWQPAEQRLYLLDLGMVGDVGADTRELIILLLLALWQEDSAFLTDVSVMLSGADRGHLDLEAYRKELEALMARYRGASIADIQIGPLLQAMIEVSLRHRAPLPASLALAAKSLAQMQLVAAQLDPTLEPFDVAGQFLTRSLVRNVIPRGDVKTLVYEAQKLKHRVTRVFEAVERLVGERPGEKPAVNVPAASFEDTVRRASRPLALGFAAGFAMLASAVTAMSERVPAWVPVIFGVGAAVLTVALLLDVNRRR
jgi:predicted unusual protein kinase regulating ubiquinone biosynthesis (AarF/ABC1/UbiB family)/nucleotide-binding universal stress UspA family protein